MSLQTAIEIIDDLTQEERKQLISVLVDRLTEKPKKHSLLELEGLGKEIWEGVDAQEYVNQLRDEWDSRP